jgi:SAM-dependent methyltransferase
MSDSANIRAAILPLAEASGRVLPAEEPITTPQPRAPLAAGWALRRTRELLDLTPLGSYRDVPAGPSQPLLPPRRLRARAGAAGAREYLEGGRQAAGELAGALARVGRTPAELEAVLDFGSGAGRVLPHFAARAPEATCAGCDVDQTAIAWAEQHRCALSWSLSSFEPPLPFAPESFDLVYSISVFSHLPRGLQDRWLGELSRVLRPGGLALLSVHGRHAFEQFRSGRVRTAWCAPEVFAREPLRAGDFVFAPYIRSVWNSGEMPGIGREYGLAFQGPEHASASWSPHLRVVEVLERALTGWQDVVVCSR